MEKNKKQNNDATDIEEQNLSHFKSPPKDSEPEDVAIGDDTPKPTTQGYAEENVRKNPADKK